MEMWEKVGALGEGISCIEVLEASDSFQRDIGGPWEVSRK